MPEKSDIDPGFVVASIRWLEDGIEGIAINLLKNNLWKRVIKNVLATTVLVIILLVPAVGQILGPAAYLGAIVTVFGHPGRRFGEMAEALILALGGTTLGMAWSTLGVYLGSLLHKENPAAAYTIRAIFLSLACIFHGYFRSKTPRLWLFVLLMLIVAVVTLISTAKAVTPVLLTHIFYPILLAIGVIICVNVLVFPEFSSSFCGETTVQTLDQTVRALTDAGHYFVGEPKKQLLKRQKTERGESVLARGKQTSLAAAIKFHVLTSRAWTLVSQTSSPFKSQDVIPPQRDPIDNTVFLSLADLTKQKANIRQKLAKCRTLLQECNFELAVAVLPPRELKPISGRSLKSLVGNVIALISACESRYALVGDQEDKVSGQGEASESQNAATSPVGSIGTGQEKSTLHPGQEPVPEKDLPHSASHSNSATGEALKVRPEIANLAAIKPIREIEYGDPQLLRLLTASISRPYRAFEGQLQSAVQVVIACIAIVYKVPRLPDRTRSPTALSLTQVDEHLKAFRNSLQLFNADCAHALEEAHALETPDGKEPDITPREEVFLISSFMLNVRQAGGRIEDMLIAARNMLDKHEKRQGRRRLYAPRIKWSKWLSSGGDETEALPTAGRRENRQQDDTDSPRDLDDEDSTYSRQSPVSSSPRRKDLEANVPSTVLPIIQEMSSHNTRTIYKPSSRSKRFPSVYVLGLRNKLADAIEWVQHSDDFLYAFKLTVALMLVTWPAFVAQWNRWYSVNRGIWAALQLVFVFEVSIGGSVYVFMLRAVGTTLGCLWGWAAIEARGGERHTAAAMVFIACIPFAYIQLGTPYPKCGMVSIVSVCVIALAAELESGPNMATELFLKRWLAFTIGGIVALIVELILLPVKARTRLVESLTSALRHIHTMETAIASGIESDIHFDVGASTIKCRFEKASAKANAALKAAETFLPSCSTEPRLKGSFKGHAIIYGEIIFVLHQIVDRMDNMLHLRSAYGSGPLEDFHADVVAYRRNVAGAITVILFAVHSALTLKSPLPQFLPSARLAHLRMINRVREVVLDKIRQQGDSDELAIKLLRHQAVKQKYLSWNATTAAQAEVIEFLEELIDLVKLLVGASEFRSGLLLRPSYQEYIDNRAHDPQEKVNDESALLEPSSDIDDPDEEARDEIKIPDHLASRSDTTVRRRRRMTAGSASGSIIDPEDVPGSLRRIQSRKQEANLQRQRTKDPVM